MKNKKKVQSLDALCCKKSQPGDVNDALHRCGGVGTPLLGTIWPEHLGQQQWIHSRLLRSAKFQKSGNLGTQFLVFSGKIHKILKILKNTPQVPKSNIFLQKATKDSRKFRKILVTTEKRVLT